MTQVALDCGKRLKSREKNMLTAFTYGIKVKQAELGNENDVFFKNILLERRAKSAYRNENNRIVNLRF